MKEKHDLCKRLGRSVTFKVQKFQRKFLTQNVHFFFA